MNFQPIHSGRKGRPPAFISEDRLFLILSAAFIVVLVLLVVLTVQYLMAIGSSSAARLTAKPASVAAVPTSANPLLLPTGSSLTPQPSAEPTLNANVKMVCMYEVQSGDWLGKIVQSFDVAYSDTEKYFDRPCEKKNDLLQCGPAEVIEVNSDIYPGEWVEIPGVNQTDCLSNGGETGLTEK